MATFRKTKKGGWRAEVYKSGHRASATFTTKNAAREWAVEKELELCNSNTYINKKTVGDAFIRYSTEVSPHKLSGKNEIKRLNAFCKMPIANISLSKLKPQDIADFREQRLNEVHSDSVLRELTILSAVFTCAVNEWEWLKENPVKKIRKPKESPPRNRRISDNEISIICKKLHYSLESSIFMKTQLVGAFFNIAIETGMRLGEICEVFNNNRDKIHIHKRYVHIPYTKNGDARDVPLSRKARKIILQIIDTDIKVTSESAGTLFRKARDACKIENLRFHDSRHEACSRLAKKLDVLNLAKMLGHRDLKSLMIYYNPTASEIAELLD